MATGIVYHCYISKIVHVCCSLLHPRFGYVTHVFRLCMMRESRKQVKNNEKVLSSIFTPKSQHKPKNSTKTEYLSK